MAQDGSSGGLGSQSQDRAWGPWVWFGLVSLAVGSSKARSEGLEGVCIWVLVREVKVLGF